MYKSNLVLAWLPYPDKETTNAQHNTIQTACTPQMLQVVHVVNQTDSHEQRNLARTNHQLESPVEMKKILGSVVETKAP